LNKEKVEFEVDKRGLPEKDCNSKKTCFYKIEKLTNCFGNFYKQHIWPKLENEIIHYGQTNKRKLFPIETIQNTALRMARGL